LCRRARCTLLSLPPSQVIDAFPFLGFLLYCFTVLIFSLIMAYGVAARHGRTNPLMYISIASFVGGVSVMFFKGMKAYTTWSYSSLRVYTLLLYGPATTCILASTTLLTNEAPVQNSHAAKTYRVLATVETVGADG
jgi:hypothetical protein